jgi:nucleotide-binding universal stress UspA family protein
MTGSAENGSQPAGRCLALGFDRNESSRRAAEWAARDLLPNGKLVFVHACRPLHAPPSPISTAGEREQLGRAIIDEFLLEGESSLRDLELAIEILDTDPVTALIDAATRHQADAIVVGSEQHSRVHRAIGVVTAELLKRAPVPVIAVPQSVLSR